MGVADLLYLGQPNPQQQLAALLAGQQPGGQPPQAGPPAPSPGAQPGGPGQQPQQPPAPPTPQAYQSPPDLQAANQQLANPPNIMSLYMQMDQRNHAEDQINRGLALIAANHSMPSMRQSIMDSMTGGAPNAGEQVNNLMSLYSAQQSMGAQQQLLGQADAIAAKTGMDVGVVRAEILAGRGAELIKSLEPTTETRDINAKHDMFIKNGGSEEDWKTNYLPFIITGGMGGGDATTKSWQQDRIMWDRDHPGEPYPWGSNTPSSYGLWKTQQGEMVKDQEDARDKLHKGYEQNLTELRGHLGNVIGLKPGGDPNNPDDYDQAKQALLQSALSKPGAQAYLSADPRDLVTQALGSALSPEEKTLLDEVRATTDPKSLYGTLGQRAPRRGQSDVSEVNAGLNDMTNVRKPFDIYKNGVISTITAADKALGNGYGAAGEAENAPDYTKPLISDAYLPGGSMYPFDKKARPMSQDDIAQATAKMKAAQDPEKERQILIKIARANNYDVKPLQNLRP